MENRKSVIKDDTAQIEFLKRWRKESHELGIKEPEEKPKIDSEESIKFLRKERELEKNASEIVGIEGFFTYLNDDDYLRFAFEYPKNWILDKKYAYAKEGISITITGPLKNRTQKVEIRVIITPSEKCEEPDILEKYVNYRITRYIYKDLKVLSKVKTDFSDRNLESIDILISYPFPVDSSRSLYGIIKKRALVAKNHCYFFELSYSADERDFDRYLEAYEHAKQTFKFLE